MIPLDPRELIAIHEAGHAVACDVLVRRAYHPITIVPTDRDLGSAHSGGMHFPGVSYSLQEVDAEVQVLLAGMAAEEIIGGSPGAFEDELEAMWGGDDDRSGCDMARALSWLKVGGFDDETRRLLRVSALYRRCRRLMERPDVRAAVMILVDRLLQVGVIGEAGVSPKKWALDQEVMGKAEALTSSLAKQRRRRFRKHSCSAERAA